MKRFERHYNAGVNEDPIRELEGGSFVLYTDYLAALAEKDEQIAALEAAVKEKDDRIHGYEQYFRGDSTLINDMNKQIAALTNEMDKWKSRAIATALHIPQDTLCGDIQGWVGEYKEQITTLMERLSKWEASSLCAKRIDIEQEGKDG